MTRTASILISILTALSLAACGGNDSTGPGGGGNGGGGNGSGGGGGGGGGDGDDGGGGGGGGGSVVEIRMQNTAFVGPSGGDAVTVTVGTRIEWVNLDNIQHTATSSSEPAGGAAFDSGLMGNGDTFSFTPQVEGTWVYFCEVHPGIMVGATITATSGATDAPGSDPGDDPGNDPPYDDPSDPYGSGTR